MILLSRILLLLVIIVLLVFCISNLNPVTVRFLAWQSMEMPFFLVMLFIFFLGFALALLWQALRSLTTPRRTRSTPIPAPVVTQKTEPEKVKRSWGFKKNNKAATEGTKDATLPATSSTTAGTAPNRPAGDPETEAQIDAEVDTK